MGVCFKCGQCPHLFFLCVNYILHTKSTEMLVLGLENPISKRRNAS